MWGVKNFSNILCFTTELFDRDIRNNGTGNAGFELKIWNYTQFFS